MTEADEVAAVMLGSYKDWLKIIGLNNRRQLAREFVRERMREETETIIDNVAEALYNAIQSP